jgi:beta-aspartyl-peptidase (threonine type)
VELIRLAIHGGAGAIDRAALDGAAARAALRAALQDGWEVLAAGGRALDAAVRAVRCLEDSGTFNAGRAAVTASDGSVSLDAAVMDGPTRAAGAVGCLTGFPSAVAVARLVLDRTPHVLLVGPGAEAFAAEQGLARVPPGYFVRSGAAVAPDTPGTVGAVAVDAAGALAAATSTGGIRGKRPGRVGDSPLVGAGTWADERCAVSATGDGELFVRAVFAFRVASAVERGVDLTTATAAALREVERLGGRGGCVAVTADGQVALPFDTGGMFRGVIDADGARVAIFGEPLG